MKTSTSRLMELALKGLELERERIDTEIQVLQQEITASARAGRGRGRKAGGKKPKRQITISPEESRRRSERMKAYWAEWRKKRAAKAKARGRKA